MAFTYPNGLVPQNLFITFASGWLPNEGTWYHQLTPGTYAKHLSLVALAKRNTGRTLKISEGWGAYRPLHIQEYAKKVHGRGAAEPGYSSHGMFWEGIVCAAIDYGNWGYVYNWDRAAFYRDVRAVGLVPGLIHPSRNRTYPDEPWHVVDKNPWAAGAATAGGAVPFAPTLKVEFEEDDDMRNPAMVHTTANDTLAGTPDKYIITDTNGFFLPILTSDASHATRLGTAYGVTNNSQWVTKSVARQIEQSCAEVREGK